jgi:hypothetical protein
LEGGLAIEVPDCALMTTLPDLWQIGLYLAIVTIINLN